jgi:hypothetical protein
MVLLLLRQLQHELLLKGTWQVTLTGFFATWPLRLHPVWHTQGWETHLPCASFALPC